MQMKERQQGKEPNSLSSFLYRIILGNGTGYEDRSEERNNKIVHISFRIFS